MIELLFIIFFNFLFLSQKDRDWWNDENKVEGERWVKRSVIICDIFLPHRSLINLITEASMQSNNMIVYCQVAARGWGGNEILPTFNQT